MVKALILMILTITLTSCGDDWKIDGKIYKFENTANNAFIIHGPLQEPNKVNKGFMNNPGLIVGKSGLIIIDAGGTYQVGKKVIIEAEKISRLPIVAVFNTHIHGDHWLGSQAILEKYPNAKIYAHPKMIKRLKDGYGETWVELMDKFTGGASKGSKVTMPTNPVKHLDKIIVAGEEFIIHAPTNNAHTNTDIMIEHKNSASVFMGDNDFLNRLGQFDNSSDIHNNIAVLEYVKSLNAKTYVPGHGKSGNYQQAITPFLTYLKTIKEFGLKAYEDDKQAYEIKDEALKSLQDYKNWSRFEEVVGPHLIKVMAEIEERDF